ncbi:type IA DNA topoisomerase [Shouchella miscanthi]|uniref:type IA DNA topoisomerase n=1 Tax=Shouchella miscanthi TaxID=2598861 RepID=UPI0011A44CE0|nr:type IA DNA topoisomerase [Shouchella miscanthi]
MKTVILAEKPSQARVYAEAFQKTSNKGKYIEVQDTELFPNQTVVLTWAIGHLLQPQPPSGYKEEWEKWSLDQLPMFPESFVLEVAPDKKDQYQVVERELKAADHIIIATDIDREGENIARSIIHKAGCMTKKISRLWINSLEAEEVQRGFLNLQPGEQSERLYTEAQTRQISDWLVGMNASRLYSLSLQQRSGKGDRYSVGRVQSSLLMLIYQRQLEVESFQSKPFFDVKAEIQTKNGSFEAKVHDRFETNEEAKKLLTSHGVTADQKQKGAIDRVQRDMKEQKAPKLFSLSGLQSAMGKRYGYSPDKVKQITQSLYDQKVLSYPRTGCEYITKNELSYLKAQRFAYQELLNVVVDVAHPEGQKRHVNGEKVQEHYAIVPTKTIPTDAQRAKWSEEEWIVYQEVVATTLTTFAPPYEYEETSVEASINRLSFSASGKVPKKEGWKELFSFRTSLDSKREESAEQEPKLPPLQEGENANVKPFIHEGKTKPPRLYTESQLINVMKTCGKAVDDEELTGILNDIEGIGTEATRDETIKKIKKGRYIEIKSKKVHITAKGRVLCAAVKGSLLGSPDMTAKWEQYLAKIGEGTGSQDTFLANIRKFIRHEIKEGSSRVVGDTLVGQYLQTIEQETYVGKCPSCQDGKMVDRKTFYGCDQYKNGCKQTLPKTIFEKKLTQNQIQTILSGQTTGKLKGFKSKQGKSFHAKLTLENNRIKPVFN